MRRVNLDRFPCGLFYVIRPPEIWLPAVLHASSDTQTTLAERRAARRVLSDLAAAEEDVQLCNQVATEAAMMFDRMEEEMGRIHAENRP